MSGCDVCIGGGVDEVYAESASKDKRARRAHLCCECGSLIQKGAPHEHAAGRDEYWGDGDRQSGWDHYHTCALCTEIRKVFTCGESWTYRTLWEDMQELAFPVLTTASKCCTELSPAAKAFVLERWREWKGLKGAAER